MARILVVDDNPELLDTISLVLEGRRGHQATLSADGAEGLARALADPPDLAIIDVMMPGISGYEICRRLRADPRTASVPIIILTARGQSVDRQAALDAGADDYIVKPVPMDELLRRIDDLLEKRRGEKPLAPVGMTALLSLRGGVGVTTLAVNLAATLAQVGGAEGGKATCLVDLCSSSGHVALQLGLRPEPNWTGLAQVTVPDAEIIEAHLLRHASGLRVLASPLFPVVGWQGLSLAAAQTMLWTLQQRFTATVVDTSPVLNEMTMAALEAATVIGLVITAEPPSIQAAVGTLRALKQWSGKFRIILNHVTPGSMLSTGTIERALKRPLVAAIPFDPEQARALALGTPLVFHNPTSPLAQAVQKLTQALDRQRLAVNR